MSACNSIQNPLHLHHTRWQCDNPYPHNGLDTVCASFHYQTRSTTSAWLVHQCYTLRALGTMGLFIFHLQNRNGVKTTNTVELYRRACEGVCPRQYWPPYLFLTPKSKATAFRLWSERVLQAYDLKHCEALQLLETSHLHQAAYTLRKYIHSKIIS